MTFIASVLKYDDIFFEDLLTKEKLNPLPAKKVNIQDGQVGLGVGQRSRPKPHLRYRLCKSLWATLDCTNWSLGRSRDMSVTYCSEHSMTAQ